MNKNRFYSIIEKLQKDYFSLYDSREYRLGLKCIGLFDALRRHYLFNFLKKEWIYRKNARFSVHTQCTEFNYGEYPSTDIKIAVYSCITGGYDELIEPFFDIEGIDYIMFTDNHDIVSEKWEIRPIPENITMLNNNIQINRYVKMHPNIVGAKYDYALYIDGNICVVSNIKNMINVLNPQTGFALHRHSSRDCIYDEVQACKNLKRGNIDKLNEQVSRYRNAGFPAHYGLLEATIILTDLHNPTALDLQEKWWQEFLRSESRRDQIALPYVLWSNHVKLNDIGNLGCPIQRNPKFRKFDHK